MSPLYPDPQGFDLREVFHGLMFGDYRTPGIGRPVLLRRLSDKYCVCWDGVTGSPNSRCAYCQGEGFEFTETRHTMYIARNFGSVLSGSTPIPQQNDLSQIGWVDSNRALAYCEYDVFPEYERYSNSEHPTMDKLYELKVTDTGELCIPEIRTRKWKIRSVTPHHGDWGRIEYFELGLEAEVL